jgi:hypothetical protein
VNNLEKKNTNTSGGGHEKIYLRIKLYWKLVKYKGKLDSSAKIRAELIGNNNT